MNVDDRPTGVEPVFSRGRMGYGTIVLIVAAFAADYTSAVSPLHFAPCLTVTPE